MQTINQKTFEINPQNNSQPSSPASRPTLKLGLDVHLQWIMVVVQEGHQTPKAPRKFTRQELVGWVKEKVAAGHAVWCVQEACGFGFVLHRELVAAGAKSIVITPMPLNVRGRKTDKLDALQLCLRLSRYVDGNTQELAPIRIPSEAEQRRREVSRRREFLQREIRRLDNRGRGLVLEHCHETLPSGWWGPRKWKWNCHELEPLFRAIL